MFMPHRDYQQKKFRDVRASILRQDFFGKEGLKQGSKKWMMLGGLVVLAIAVLVIVVAAAGASSGGASAGGGAATKCAPTEVVCAGPCLSSFLDGEGPASRVLRDGRNCCLFGCL